MIEDYGKKDMKAPESTMKAPKPSGMVKPENMEDGKIFEKDGLWFFKWKGGECGYHSQEDAEAGLKKLSGNGEG